MSALVQLCTTGFALALIAGAFRYVFDPRGATAMLKAVATRLLAVVFGVAVLTTLIADFPQRSAGAGQPSGWSLLLFLLLVSLCAYCIREFRLRWNRKETDRGGMRGAERTPVLPNHMEDDQ